MCQEEEGEEATVPFQSEEKHTTRAKRGKACIVLQVRETGIRYTARDTHSSKSKREKSCLWVASSKEKKKRTIEKRGKT